MYALNPAIAHVSPSPVAEAQSWLQSLPDTPDKPLLDVAQAVPGYPPATALQQHLAQLSQQSETAFYTPILGITPLRQALAEHMNTSYQATITSEQVAIVAGCNQGFCATLAVLAAAGDEVILPLPYYFNHQMWSEMIGVNTVALPFDEAHRAIPSADATATLITPKTRAIALVSPNNPTGAVYPAAVLDDFYQLAKAHGLALIIDETYKDFREATQPAHHLFAYPDWQETFIQLYSFSKIFSLTGYRVGSVIGAEALLQQLGKFQDCVAICAPRIGQDAALYGLQHLQDWCAEKRQLMQHRSLTLHAAFADPRLRYQIVPQGAYFAYVKHPFTNQPSATVAKHLVAAHRVLCLPGSTFGPNQDAYLRLAFANLDAGDIPDLIERLIDSQDDLLR